MGITMGYKTRKGRKKLAKKTLRKRRNKLGKRTRRGGLPGPGSLLRGIGTSLYNFGRGGPVRRQAGNPENKYELKPKGPQKQQLREQYKTDREDRLRDESAAYTAADKKYKDRELQRIIGSPLPPDFKAIYAFANGRIYPNDGQGEPRDLSLSIKFDKFGNVQEFYERGNNQYYEGSKNRINL